MNSSLQERYSPKLSTSAFSWFLLISLALIWGSSFILIKKGLVSFSAIEVGALRIFSAGIVFVPLAVIKMKHLSRKKVFLLFFSGLLGSFFPAFLFAQAQTQLSSSVTGVLNALTPFFVLIIGVLVFKASISWRKALGIFIGFIGAVFLILAREDGEVAGIKVHAFYVVAATICYGFNLNIIKNYLQEEKSLTITSVSLAMIMPLAAYLLFRDSQFIDKFSSDPQAWTSLGYIATLGLIGTAFALILFNRLVNLTSPIFTSSVTYLIPIVAVLWGLLDGETLYFGYIVGMTAIIIGIFLSRKD
ncbi:MAG: DMT family transporter [Cyclobacteriaceae bacterium]|nr:DMT family transporter [Cyclobacteriaceae bacterium]MCH8516663.1 DMT family transporter [Cyclobacteriaceae bacterium]